MKFMRQVLRSAVPVLVVVLLLGAAACSGDPDGEDASADDENGADDPADAGDDESDDDAADEDEAFAPFEGETITFIVPFGAGGGFDLEARALAPYLSEILGANIVIDNQPGAGSLLGISNLHASDPDGLTIAYMNGPGVMGAALAGAEGVQFDVTEFEYIGAVGVDPVVIAVGADSPYETFQDIVSADSFRWGAAGPGTRAYLNAFVLSEFFDMSSEIITGYEGAPEVALAVTRGDVDGTTQTLFTGIPLAEAGDHRLVAMLDDARHPDVPDVPAITEELEEALEGREASVEEVRQFLDIHINLQLLNRPIIAPPGVDEERVRVLREAFDQATSSPELLAEWESNGWIIDFYTGEEIEGRVMTVIDAPPAYIEVLSAGSG